MQKTPISGALMTSMNMKFCDYFMLQIPFNDALNYKHRTVDHVYHYTTLDGFKGIIQSQCIWATNLFFLNDKKEFQHGIDIMLNALNKVKKTKMLSYVLEMKKEIDLINSSDRYVACFCKNGDILSQWRAYGDNGAGISIGFRSLHFRLAFEKHIKTKYMLYNQRRQSAAITATLELAFDYYSEMKPLIDCIGYNYENIVARSLITLFEEIISNFKHPAFSEEKEYRVEYTVLDFHKNKTHHEISYRERNEIKIPYVELETKAKFYERYKKESRIPIPTLTISKLPIEKIIIGPTFNYQNFSMENLKQFLRENGYEHVAMKKSKIPYTS